MLQNLMIDFEEALDFCQIESIHWKCYQFVNTQQLFAYFLSSIWLMSKSHFLSISFWESCHHSCRCIHLLLLKFYWNFILEVFWTLGEKIVTILDSEFEKSFYLYDRLSWRTVHFYFIKVINSQITLILDWNSFFN